MEKLLTPEETADLLAVQPKTVRDWLRSGKLPGVKVGSLWRVQEASLREFVAPPPAAPPLLPPHEAFRRLLAHPHPHRVGMEELLEEEKQAQEEHADTWLHP